VRLELPCKLCVIAAALLMKASPVPVLIEMLPHSSQKSTVPRHSSRVHSTSQVLKNPSSVSLS
jgi:hypothetical protein